MLHTKFHENRPCGSGEENVRQSLNCLCYDEKLKLLFIMAFECKNQMSLVVQPQNTARVLKFWN